MFSKRIKKLPHHTHTHTHDIADYVATNADKILRTHLCVENTFYINTQEIADYVAANAETCIAGTPIKDWVLWDSGPKKKEKIRNLHSGLWD